MTRAEANRYRRIIEHAAQYLDDNIALTVINLYPEWEVNNSYTIGYKVQKNDKLWSALQAHTSQSGWEPENVASLWEQINETHAGTLEDPIPYDGNMALTSGLCYTQNGAVYLCTRDTVNPVYQALSDLVGIYVDNV